MIFTLVPMISCTVQASVPPFPPSAIAPPVLILVLETAQSEGQYQTFTLLTTPIVDHTMFCVPSAGVISPLVTGQTVFEIGAVKLKLPTILKTSVIPGSVPLAPEPGTVGSPRTSLTRITTFGDVVVG